MNMTRTLSVLAPIAMLSACGSTSSDPTSSSFASPTVLGTFLGTPLNNERAGSEFSGGDGYAYRVGTNSDGALAQSGLTTGTSVIAAGPSSVVSYTGSYEVARIRNIDVNNGFLTGQSDIVSGGLVLNADFGAGTLTGSGGGGALTVNGTLSGQNIGGTVQYLGTTGQLTGLAGSDQAIGAFHGNGDTVVYGGGFIADAN